MEKLPNAGIDPANGKKIKRSTGWYGCSTIFARDQEPPTPYMTRVWFSRLRLHIFHRGDTDPDCHDHPWGFWTFPLTSYVEEVVLWAQDVQSGTPRDGMFQKVRQVAPAWRLSYRPAEHCHRVLGRYVGKNELGQPLWDDGKLITIVLRGRAGRDWGFLKNRDGRWCWIGWKEYVFAGGKNTPCQ